MAKEQKEETRKDEGEQTEEPQAKPKGKKKLFIIVGGVVALLLCIGLPLAFMGGGKKAAAGEGEELMEAEKHYATFDMDTIIVNLSEVGTFLKVTLTIEYDPELLHVAGSGGGGGGGYGGGAMGGEGAAGGGGTPPVFAEREPMIKSAVIAVLSSKKAADILSRTGKEQLKDELIEAINEALGLDESPVVSIYFKEFIIQ